MYINPFGTKLVKITYVYLSNHLINIGVAKYGPSTFKCRVACIFPSSGCKDPSYRMQKILTYILKYFMRTGGYRFYTLLFLKWLRLLPTVNPPTQGHGCTPRNKDGHKLKKFLQGNFLHQQKFFFICGLRA